MTNRDLRSRYYDAGGIEVQDVIKAKLTHEQYKGWLMGNVFKYSMRANFKGQFNRDIEKLGFYVRWLEEENNSSPDAPLEDKTVEAADGHVDQKSMQWVDEHDDYLPTKEYAMEEKDPLRKVFVTTAPKWADQSYIESLIKKEQDNDKKAGELAKSLTEKYNGECE